MNIALLAAAVGIAGSSACSSKKTPEAVISPVPTGTPLPTPSITPTIEPTPTITPIASSTPLSPERELLSMYEFHAFGQTGEETESDYPAWLNRAGNERTGINLTTVGKLKDYFQERVNSLNYFSDPGMQDLDRMFGQLSRKVVDPTDRSLNFDWNNGGQGLGFTVEDFDVLRTFEEMKGVQEATKDGIFGQISRQSQEDFRYRAWTISEARDFEKTILAYVDEYLRLRGIVNPAINTSIQTERRRLFEDIVFGDLGVQAPDDMDEYWQTISNDFSVCETFTQAAEVRSEQPEVLRNVRFDENRETLDNGEEEETVNQHDSRNHLLTILLTDGSFIRVEVYDLSNPPDPLNPGLDPIFAEGDPARVYGGRWLPCGPGLSVPLVSKRTTPTPYVPTPVPTNPHRDEENPEDTDQPDRTPSTQMPW